MSVAGGEPRRNVIRRALTAATRAASPSSAIARCCRLMGDVLEIGAETRIDLAGFARTVVVGAGKATPVLAAAFSDLAGARVAGGTIATKDGHGVPLPFDLWEAGHPIPDARSLAAAAEALLTARSLTPNDLLVCLLSGGASALWTAPAAGLTLRDVQRTTDALLRSGAPIDELNAVRKHLSRIAGGQLARTSGAGRIVTLAISDVLGDRPDVIGSGPTVPDPTSFADAIRIIRSRGAAVPSSVAHHLQLGLAGAVEETPKPGEPLWRRSSYHIVASLADALPAAAASLEADGYLVSIETAELTGEAREAGSLIAASAIDAATGGAEPRRALLWGGETTVQVRGRGKGGRNQEMALAAALELSGRRDIVVACFGTDGTDGPTDAAGGFADGSTAQRARAAGVDPLDALARNDSYACLSAAEDLIVTGPTGTNVNDIAIALVG